MLATTASETCRILQENPEIITQLRENIKTIRAQLDPRSDWVVCSSSVENPIMLLVLKPEVVESKRLNVGDQEQILQDCVDE
ncbi:serine palmitoyltransferase component, partial [Cryomyces antarcticus]